MFVVNWIRNARQGWNRNAKKSHAHLSLCKSLRCESLESRHLMATFQVTTTADSQAIDLNTGLDATGQVSLRSAIMAANHLGGFNTVTLPTDSLGFAQTFDLTIGGSSEDGALTGDLDIRNKLTINANFGEIHASNSDRVFDVFGNALLELNDASVSGGREVRGGAIYNRGRLTLHNSSVNGVVQAPAGTSGYGGGIFNAANGVLTSVDSFIDGQITGGNSIVPGGVGGNAFGGALYNLGRASLTNTNLLGSIQGGAGGIGVSGLSGSDSSNLSAPDGTDGGMGGRGGNATGGALYNGPAAVLDGVAITVRGTASGGAGGNGGIGGAGANASIPSPLVTLPAGIGGAGGAGGVGGAALGGAVYSAGIFNITASLTTSLLIGAPNSFFGKAFGGVGGRGSDGGSGGSGISNPTTEQIQNAADGGLGGRGGNGGAAQGGGLYMASGQANISDADFDGLDDGVLFGAYSGFGGQGGNGGLGGTSFASPGFGDGGTGNTGGRGGAADGGALYAAAGTLTITNSTLSAGARGGGSGRSGVGGSPGPGANQGVTALGVSGVTAYGGGIVVVGATVNLVQSSVQNSIARGGEAGRTFNGQVSSPSGSAQGGGIALKSGTLSIVDSSLSRNNALGTQGTVQGDTIAATGGNGGSGFGGGLAALSGSVTILRSTLNENMALGAKGQNGTTGTSAIGGNGGSGFGGGIYATNATVNIVNSTLHGNQAGGGARGLSGTGVSGTSAAGRGGGMYHSGSGIVTLNNVTVARNQITDVNGSTLGNGAGLYNLVGVVQVHNSLIALNDFAPTIVGNGKDANGTFSSQGFNLIGIRTGSAGFIASDKKGTLLAPLNPKLGDLLNNGGFTLTCAIDSTSAARNAGDLANPLSEDQRGVARNIDRIDIGAFEFIASATLKGTKR